jgi:hypothetical protein
VTVSREAFCPLAPDGSVAELPGRTTVRIGPIGVGPDKQPVLAGVTGERAFVLPACKAQTVLLRPPDVPWRLEVTSDTFVPAEVDPDSGDRRELGARVDFGFVGL